MFKTFTQIPEPLQKQILYRIGYGIVFLLITIASIFYKMELFSILSCIIIIFFCFVSSISLLRKAIIGNYVVICGDCISVNLTTLKRHTKTIILRMEDNRTLKVMIKHRLKKINTGSKIMLYISSDMPIYEDSGGYLLQSYLAIKIKDKAK